MDASTLATAMGCSLSVAQRYVADFNVALRHAGCTTVNRAAMFCAQIGHESVGLRYMEEIASGAAYEGRADLGNIYPGDGRRYKGRGPIQLTGRHNYGQFGKWAKAQGLVSNANYFVNNPTQVATSRWGFLAASWYWTVARSQINGMCDRADVVGVTRAINGGTNGLADRISRWNRCRGMGARLLPSGANKPAPKKTASTATDPGYEDATMELPPGKGMVRYIPAAGRKPYLYVQTGYGTTLLAHEITFIGQSPKDRNKRKYTGKGYKNFKFLSDRPGPIKVPAGTMFVAIRYTLNAGKHYSATAYVG